MNLTDGMPGQPGDCNPDASPASIPDGHLGPRNVRLLNLSANRETREIREIIDLSRVPRLSRFESHISKNFSYPCPHVSARAFGRCWGKLKGGVLWSFNLTVKLDGDGLLSDEDPRMAEGFKIWMDRRGGP